MNPATGAVTGRGIVIEVRAKGTVSGLAEPPDPGPSTTVRALSAGPAKVTVYLVDGVPVLLSPGAGLLTTGLSSLHPSTSLGRGCRPGLFDRPGCSPLTNQGITVITGRILITPGPIDPILTGNTHGIS